MTAKKKLRQFEEMNTFPNVVQVAYSEVIDKHHPFRGKWASEAFGNGNPIVIELGCGKGEYTVGMARLFPERNFIGVDIKGARMWRGAKTALGESLKNVCFLRTRIDFIDSFFTTDEIDEIWLTFPDPQVRRSRERKRLTSPGFIQKYMRFLRPHGLLHLKTDSHIMYDYSIKSANQMNLSVLLATSSLYGDLEKLALADTEKEILTIRTHYENIFVQQGSEICYLKMQRTND